MNNILICIGRITRDLELRYTTNNKAVVNIPLAINNGKDDTTFIDVVVYGNIAETTRIARIAFLGTIPLFTPNHFGKSPSSAIESIRRLRAI